MKIEFSRPSRTFILGAAAVLVLLGAAAAWRSGLLGGKPAPVPEPTAVPGGDAARAGVEAFLSVDFSKGRDAWLERLCALTDEQGCKANTMMAEMMWAGVEKKKQRTACTVQSLELVKTGEQDGTAYQVWKVKAEITDLNTQQKSAGEMYAMTVKDGEAWKFNHVLLDFEQKALERELAQTPTAEVTP